ncbi:S8 family serine peptidase [uncultured Bacteroides sp.]|uniref:S8 family peptidase n=1 Tax=uncultured Bacteroides sp. TaxID=162156 RepID=UPI002610404C|nr:S8 family serine peptidase [uncultured Bacteroides sp.]
MNRFVGLKIFCCLTVIALFCGCNDSFLIENDPTVEKSIQVEDGIMENTKYYWYEGEKIYLEEIPEKEYIVFKKKDLQELSLLKSRSSSPISKEEFQELKLTGITLTDKAATEKDKVMWGITESNTRSAIVGDIPAIIYRSPFYKSSLGEEIGISHLFYVKLKSEKDKEKLIELATINNVEIIGFNEFMPLWYTLSCDNESAGDALQMANEFYESGLFEFAEPDLIGNFKLTTNDTYFSNQWNLNGSNSINWVSAYALTQGASVNVAIIDSGIEQLHPDLANVMPAYDLVEGWWYATNIYNAHGTACAGIIGATANNNKGIAGIAPKVAIESYAHNFGTQPNAGQQLASGIALASRSADVISCSWGGPTSSLITDAIRYEAGWGRNGKGTVVVFASGNEGRSSVSFPANCHSSVIAVGSIGQNGRRSSFSNYGTELDIVAPGEKVPTTDLLYGEGYNKPDYYMDFGGTSAACPEVAAVAALILSVNNNLTAQEVKDIIEKTARKVGGYSYTTVSGRPNGIWNREMGYGLVDAYNAVLEAKRRL